VLLAWAIRQARRDVNVFAQLCFTGPDGQPLRQATVHRQMQAFLDQQRRALIELPRDHGKSVQMCLRVLWELGRSPRLRVKIVCATEALAVERSQFLRDAISNNARLRLVFPHLQPGQPWTATRFSLRAAAADLLGPTVTAVGVGAGLTGARADLLICDDIVDVRALHSQAVRQSVQCYFHENLLNLLEPDGRVWALFTPWHRQDLNSQLKANPAFSLFRRAVGDDLEPVWPEKWPRHRLEQRRAEVGASAFARAYRLCLQGEADALIRPEWVQYWLEPTECESVVLAVDPAVSEQARADASALVVVGRAADGRLLCLEAIARRVGLPMLLELIADADARYAPDVILFESNAAFAGVRDLLVQQAHYGGKVLGISQSRSKRARLEALSVSVQNQRFCLRGQRVGGYTGVHPAQQELYDQLIAFPHGDHDDLADAAATAVAHLLQPRQPRVW
jgi:predicted phage terminase large subunit-like protein